MKKDILKILSRSSTLAQAQVREIMTSFPSLEWTPILKSSFGDTHKEISLLDPIASNFFTDEIDSALLAGEGDIAIHSAKDLPYPLAQGLEVIALTKAINQSDSLVCREKHTLATLPSGSRIGTSSPARKEQILALRNDAAIVSIRGTIEERIAQVDSGAFDAVVVATCALERLNLKERISELLPFSTHPLQGSLAVVARVGCPELKVLFRKIDHRANYGKVWLVGGGPGDPELLTIKADRVLSTADIIFYDDLLNNSLLNKYSAEMVYVGKRKGHHAFSQDEMNEQLYQAALSGKETVRLKGGDPLIFSRGGEELEYLQRRLISVEVVPGLSAFQVCAASVGIPLTSRNVSRSLGIASGHYALQSDIPHLKTDTQIYYMAATKLSELARQLIARGTEPTTPVAVVKSGGLPEEISRITTVGSLGDVVIESPATVIVGNVAQFYRAQERVLYTGIDPAHFKHTAHVIHYPLIETASIDFAIENQEQYDSILFTSKKAVEYFVLKQRILQKRVIALGSGTAQALRGFGYSVDYISEKPSSESMILLLQQHPEWRILYPCSNLSKNGIHALPQVTSLVVYETKSRVQEKIALEGYSSIVFSSPSTVDSFLELYRAVPDHILCIVMGSVTLKKLLACGVSQERIMVLEATSPPFGVVNLDLTWKCSSFMKNIRRFRQHRIDEATRRAHRETQLYAQDFIWPVFLVAGSNVKQEIPSMPGVYRYSVDVLAIELVLLVKLGLSSVLLFGVPDTKGIEQAWSDAGIVQQAIPIIKEHFPNLEIITDVCICSFTSDGHCHIGDNDATCEILAKIAVSHTCAGANVVAPSAMMDGQVLAIRSALDIHNFSHVPIMSYAAKFASNFYGPFRDAADCAPASGDRKTYQMDYANGNEALEEIQADLDQGTHAVIVKPALSYLDVIARAHDRFTCEIIAYNVSGEYAMLVTAVKNGMLREEVVEETLVSIKRAGASRIISYFTPRVLKLLKREI